MLIVPDAVTEFLKIFFNNFGGKYLDFKYFTEFLKRDIRKKKPKSTSQTIPSPEMRNGWLYSIICITK